MTEYKEFQGKSLDEAIQEACAYYGVEREKLEIEIVNDAKTGIFGLVSMKKACVRAAKSAPATSALLEETLHPENAKSGRGKGKKTETPTQEPEAKPAKKAEKLDKPQKLASEKTAPEKLASEKIEKDEKKVEKPGRGRKNAKTDAPSAKAPRGKATSENKADQPAPAGTLAQTGNAANLYDEDEFAMPGDANGNVGTSIYSTVTRPERKPKRQERPAKNQPRQERQDKPIDNSHGEALPEVDLLSLDQALVATVAEEAVKTLITPIVGEVPCTITISTERIRVQVECGEDSGILVGREGQTLASVQYIAGRIIGNKLGGSVRLSIDTGNYRERQNDRLNELALSLAEKVKATGRTQSTRPLSAFQRRIIHLALEGDEAVQTSSKGEGSQRRVLIQLKRDKNLPEQATMEAIDAPEPEYADMPELDYAGTSAPDFVPASARPPRNLDEPRPANAPPIPKYVPPAPAKPSRPPRNLDAPASAPVAEQGE